MGIFGNWVLGEMEFWKNRISGKRMEKWDCGKMVFAVDRLDPRQNIGFETEGNIGDIGILGVKYRRYLE